MKTKVKKQVKPKTSTKMNKVINNEEAPIIVNSEEVIEKSFSSPTSLH